MPYNNSNALTDREFYTGVSRFLDVTQDTIRRYWTNGFYEFIVREVWLKGTLRIPHLGTFSLKHMDEKFQTQTDVDGNKVVYRVPERDIPVFTPADDFTNDVNFEGVTKNYRRRAKANRLNPADIRRQERIKQFGEYGSIDPERVEIAKENFKEMLNKKKEESEGKSNS